MHLMLESFVKRKELVCVVQVLSSSLSRSGSRHGRYLWMMNSAHPSYEAIEDFEVLLSSLRESTSVLSRKSSILVSRVGFRAVKRCLGVCFF